MSQDLQKNGKPTGFVDLSVPKNRKAVCEEVIRICKLFEADGVMFDYEGYKGGYGKESIKRFCDVQNIAAQKFNAANISGEMAKKWEAWQRKNVKTMLFEVSKALQTMPRPRKVALCVFPGGARDVKSLKEGTTAHPGPAVWLDWLKTSHFDIVQFMLYAQDVNWLKERTNVLFPLLRTNNKKLKIESWLIYWPETCGWTNPVPVDNLLRQSDAMIRAGSDGVSFFSSSNINTLNMPYFEIFFDAMRNGVYRLAIPNLPPVKIRKVKTARRIKTLTDGVWKSKYIKTNDAVWKYYQFGKSSINPLKIKSDDLIAMKFTGKQWKSAGAGKHGHPIIFSDKFGNAVLSYVAQRKASGFGYWSAIGFCAPGKGKYSISGEIKFQRYKNGALITNADIELILFSSSGKRIKSLHLKSGKSSSISEKLPVDGIEMNKHDLLLFRPLTPSINANVPFSSYA